MNSWPRAYLLYSWSGSIIIFYKGHKMSSCARRDSIIKSILVYPMRDNYLGQKLLVWDALSLRHPRDLSLGNLLRGDESWWGKSFRMDGDWWAWALGFFAWPCEQEFVRGILERWSGAVTTTLQRFGGISRFSRVWAETHEKLTAHITSVAWHVSLGT